MSQLQLNEVLVCAEQLLAVLVGDDTETETIQKGHEISQQVAALRQKQLQQMKQDVRYLTSELNIANNAGDNGDIKTPDDLTHLQSSLQDRVEAMRCQSAAIVKDCQQLKGELTRTQVEKQTLRDQRQSQKDARTAALPKARCDYNLYSNITNLRWQFNCEPHEVKGYICNKKDVKTFSLNSQEVSRFFITNYLWDLIEEDW